MQPTRLCRAQSKHAFENFLGSSRFRPRRKDFKTKMKPLGHDFLSALRAPVKHQQNKNSGGAKKTAAPKNSGGQHSVAGEMARLYASGDHSKMSSMVGEALAVRMSLHHAR